MPNQQVHPGEFYFQALSFSLGRRPPKGERRERES